MNHRLKQGFVGKVVLLLVALFLVASYFSFDIKGFVESPMFQKNLAYVTEVGKTVWKGYLEKPTIYLWNSVFADLIKASFVQTLQNAKRLSSGQLNDLKLTPAVPDDLVPLLKPSLPACSAGQC